MDTLLNYLNPIIESLLVDLIKVVAGVLIARVLIDSYEKRRYGDWKVIIRRNGSDLVKRAISPKKAKEILTETSELSVFLKGVTSPYDYLNCDLIEEGSKLGLLIEDRDNRQFIIDLDKNPPSSKK